MIVTRPSKFASIRFPVPFKGAEHIEVDSRRESYAFMHWPFVIAGDAVWRTRR